MLRTQPASLDYFALTKAAKRLASTAPSSARVVRIAVLGDCATQQFATMIRILAHHAGVRAEVYDAGFDTVENEVFDAASGLYTFQPEVVILLNTVQALRGRYFAQKSDKLTFATDQLDKRIGLWDALRQHTQALIIQTNFVRPYERVFGNYDHQVPGSFSDAVQVMNRGLSEACRERKNLAILDTDDIASWFGRAAWFDEKRWVLAKSPCALDFLPHLAQGAVDIATASLGAGVKCVILDLDNTLWGGVIGDDGVDGIRLGHIDDGEAFVAFQAFLKELRNRGILLAVCSKNDHHNAVKPFREHPDMVLKEDDITVFVANWQNKAQNIETIKETLNIGYDSMVFLDDNVFERNLVRQMLPEVIVPELPEDPVDYVKYVASLNLFETASFSELDRQRAELYAVEAKREGLKHSFSNIEDYLKSLEMTIVVDRFDTFNLPRIAQLIQRSNQFNLATRRFNEAQCEAMMRDDAAFLPLHISLSDKFGDHGLISVVVLRRSKPEDGQPPRVYIDEYLMSCRVLLRGVEQYVMNEVFRWAATSGAEAVEGCFVPTSKNGMVKDFYAKFGFERLPDEDAPGAGARPERWERRVADYVQQTAFIQPLSGR
ncbi:MAG: HAD-IIIC family phosphatase [Myxococcales bacterium]|nr:HAD-IIIC family phosphatase [Myxococcales bacterium]